MDYRLDLVFLLDIEDCISSIGQLEPDSLTMGSGVLEIQHPLVSRREVSTDENQGFNLGDQHFIIKELNREIDPFDLQVGRRNRVGV